VTLDALERHLATEPLRRVYVVLGEARPLVDRAARAIEAAARPRIGPPAFNHGRYRAGEGDPLAAFDAARTLPMLGELRLVEIRNLDEAPPSLFEALVAYAGAPSAGAVVLASGRAFPKVEKGGSNWGVRVKNALKENGLLVQLEGGDLDPITFATEAAGQRGKILAGQDAALLVENVGTDLGHLEQEIEKLATYVGEASRITGEDIAAATTMLAEAVIWDLTTGLACRDAALALPALERLQSSGDDARKLLGMIAWQMRELLRAAELLAGGVKDNEVVSRVRLRWDLFKAVKPMLLDGFPDAADLLRRLATANRHMNSHRAGADRILEGLVLEMLEGKLRRPPPVPRPR
jgi:DNA polymerase-3 subunit delta